MFATARYKATTNSLDKARRPTNLPVEEEMRLLSEYMNPEMAKIAESFELSMYSWLRSLVGCRLIILEAREVEIYKGENIQVIVDTTDYYKYIWERTYRSL